ncbi:MAG: glycoside hydrolase family 2 [Candidatus Lokiarchaeota archaeon]|nr:glycoside hydrolase family 2 [Candidatus Lokiarchaeota archaeon]MBD3199148.1 glycoside hydrolase family 2 [Candidatus Lokiarchaeota archaeon]
MSIDQNIPRSEYPRPQLIRETDWICLNGIWEFEFDDEDVGIKQKWYKEENQKYISNKINVPFCFQSKLSGINDNAFHDIIWYAKEVELKEVFLKRRILLHFGAVDHSCKIFVNGECVGSHTGGYTPFNIDITDYAQIKNRIVLRVEDPSKDNEIPRGKQFWKEDPGWIFYPRVSGIWQSVWIESVDSKHFVEKIKLTPNIKTSEIIIQPTITGKASKDLIIHAIIKNDDKFIAEYETKLDFLGDIDKKRKRRNLLEEKIGVIEKLFKTNPQNTFTFVMKIPEDDLILWDTDNPHLYDIFFVIKNKKNDFIHDKVRSYFGMREVSLSNGPVEIKTAKETIITKNKVILLNGKPIYQKLFLLQGYWPDGLYTAPTEEAIKKDIQLIKKFGFNGLRTHQKAFDPLFLHWCDREGILVWGEMGSHYAYSIKAQKNFVNEYIEMLERDYNHPSIIAWTLLNEGWGVPGAEFDKKKINYTLMLYNMVKSIDTTRLLIDDDGWYHTKTDLCTKHFYDDIKLLPKEFNEEKEMKYPKDYESPIYIGDHTYHGEPIIYSEIGGFTLDIEGNTDNPFGYGKIESSEDLFDRVLELLKEFDRRKEWISGFCYTELYDQYQEINGLTTFTRVPKFNPEKLKKALESMFYK